MKNYINRLIGLVLLICCSFSCSSDLDFNQADNLKINPVLVGNLSYFDLPATSFVANDGSQKDLIFNDQEFDVFRDKHLKEYLQKAEFNFEINNTINRAFIITIALSDDNSQVLTTMKFDIPAYTGANNTIKQTEIFETTRLDLLKRATKMGFVISMLSGTPLDKNSTGSLVLRSSATVYMEIQ